MGVGHSTSPPPLAQGSRGEELDSRYQDYLDYMASMELMGTPGEERVNGFREFQEIQLRIARNPAMGTPWNPRRLAEPLCGMSASHRDDSLLYDHDFDDEDTTRRCDEAAYYSTSPPPLAQGSRGEELDSRYQDYLDYMASMDLMGTPGEERVNGFREFQEIQLRIARNPALGTPWNPRRIPEPLCGMSASHRADSLLYDHDFGD